MGRGAKDSRRSQLLTKPLFQLLSAEGFMGQPDNGEGDKVS